jgi:hypothetical protein
MVEPRKRENRANPNFHHFFAPHLRSHSPSSKNKSTTMPKLARRSTRSPAPPSSAGGNNGGLSPDATAFQLLKSQLEKEEWRRLSSRKGGFYDTLVKKGHTLDDAGELATSNCRTALNKFYHDFQRIYCVSFSLACSRVLHLTCHVMSCHCRTPPFSCTIYYIYALT